MTANLNLSSPDHVGSFKQGKNKPLLMWCSSHRTLSFEEIPLLLEAGFRVIPSSVDMWTFKIDRKVIDDLCPDWKSSVDVPAEVIDELHQVNLYLDEGTAPFKKADQDLINRYVDVLYVTILPNVAERVLSWFRGLVVFRPFGHGSLNTYSKVCESRKGDLDAFSRSPNYVWCPILSTLGEPEDPRITANEMMVGAFVSSGRLQGRWEGDKSEPYLVETIPRITQQEYYRRIYLDFAKAYAELPLQILGGNPPRGGDLNDERIMGTLDDEAYHRTISRCRASIYHGDSPYHVHYHPIEYMAMGVPVLFHKNSALTAEARRIGKTDAQLKECGMYLNEKEALGVAKRLLADVSLAKDISQRQRFFCTEVFSRNLALSGAQQIREYMVSSPEVQFGIARERKRAMRRNYLFRKIMAVRSWLRRSNS